MSLELHPGQLGWGTVPGTTTVQNGSMSLLTNGVQLASYLGLERVRGEG